MKTVNTQCEMSGQAQANLHSRGLMRFFVVPAGAEGVPNSFTEANATQLLNYSYFHSATGELSNRESFYK